MIVKNEEDTLGRCLDSAAPLVDEIIIVDTGSEDKTKEIAGKYTDKVYDFEWIDDFSAARNFSFEKATMDYILWLDADDIILPEDAEKFRHLKLTLDPSVDAVMMKYNVGFDEFGKPTLSYYRGRLVKRSRNFRWHEPVHEYLQVGGKVIESDICVTHAKVYRRTDERSSRNLRIYESQLAGGKKLTPRGTFYYARELKDHKRYRDAIEMYEKFLDSGQGWYEDCITACGDLALCYIMEGESEKSLLALLRSFQYDIPRAENVCQIGYYFKERGLWWQAIFWFELAMRLEKPEKSWGFIREDYWGYIPALECVICYDKLGEYEKAEEYNNKAAEYKGETAAVLHNRRYFSELKKRRAAEGKSQSRS